MTSSIFKGTRLAFLDDITFSSDAKKNIYEDDVPISAVSASASSSYRAPRRKRGHPIIMALWLIGGIATLFVPLLTRNARINRYQNNGMDQAAQEYYQMQQDYNYNGENNNGENNNGQQQQQQQQEGRQFYDINQCKWYKFNCQPYYVDENGDYVSEYQMQQEIYKQEMEQQQQQYEQKSEQQQQQSEQQQQYYQNQNGNQNQNQNGNGNQNQNQNGNQQANQYSYANNGAQGQPNWYYNNFGDSNQQMDNEWAEASPKLKYVYGWQIIMFVSLIAYGLVAMNQHKSLSFLIGALFIWFQFSFLSMFMLADGSIVTDNDAMERTGFYGQFAVLMFMTNAWYTAFGLIFFLVFVIKGQHEATNEAATVVGGDETKSGDYQAYKAPEDGEVSTTSDDSDEFVKVV